jgi:hypothetical protein
MCIDGRPRDAILDAELPANEPLSGERFWLEFYDDGYPKLPECLRRKTSREDRLAQIPHRVCRVKEIQNFDVPRTVQKQDAGPDKDFAGNSASSPPLYVMALLSPSLHTARTATTIVIVGHTAKAAPNTSRSRKPLA